MQLRKMNSVENITWKMLVVVEDTEGMQNLLLDAYSKQFCCCCINVDSSTLFSLL